MKYLEAYNFVRGYAVSKNIKLDDTFLIENKIKFRGYVGFTEFEYNLNDKILIARGYIYEGNKPMPCDIAPGASEVIF